MNPILKGILTLIFMGVVITLTFESNAAVQVIRVQIKGKYTYNNKIWGTFKKSKRDRVGMRIGKQRFTTWIDNKNVDFLMAKNGMIHHSSVVVDSPKMNVKVFSIPFRKLGKKKVIWKAYLNGIHGQLYSVYFPIITNVLKKYKRKIPAFVLNKGRVEFEKYLCRKKSRGNLECNMSLKIYLPPKKWVKLKKKQRQARKPDRA